MTACPLFDKLISESETSMTSKQLVIEIILKEVIADNRQEWFDGLSICSAPGGHTSLSGELADQAALHGLLEKIRDLNLTLLIVNIQEKNEMENK